MEQTPPSPNVQASPNHVISVLAAAMQQDPAARYFQLDAYNLPNSTIITLEQSTRFFTDILLQLHSAGAIFVETPTKEGVAVWCPPSFMWPEDSGPYLSSSMQNYGAVAEEAKTRWMGSSAYWYLFVIGRASYSPSFCSSPARKRGYVAPHLILPFVQKAEKEGVPLWLEATTEASRKVYEKLGFQVVEELKVGKGLCDAKGDLVEGGEGVSMWAMIANHSEDFSSRSSSEISLG